MFGMNGGILDESLQVSLVERSNADRPGLKEGVVRGEDRPEERKLAVSRTMAAGMWSIVG